MKLGFREAMISLFAGLGVACTTAGLKELKPEGYPSMHSFLLSSPLIIVGTVDSVEKEGWQAPFDYRGTAILFRIRVGVENVLRGSFNSQRTDVYTFLQTGSHVGPNPMSFWVGHRYIFYLREQAGRWRTACDVSDQCVDYVLSGYHGAFKRDPEQPLADDIVRLLLTRGENASDGSMVDALGRSKTPPDPKMTLETEDYATTWREERKQTYIQILRQTSETATPPLRAEACELLRGLNQPCNPCTNESLTTQAAPK